MFPYDSKDHHSRKRKFIQVGNTSADPFGLNVDVNAFHGRARNTLYYPTDTAIKNVLNRPVKSYTSLLFDDICGDDDDDDDDEEMDDNLDAFRIKDKGQVMPLDPLMESDKKMYLNPLKNESYGLWSVAISQAAEQAQEKDKQMQKLSRELYEKKRQLVSCQLHHILLEKQMKKAVKKIKYLRKSLKEAVSRPGDQGKEEEGESSFVGTKRQEEAGWLCCKVCDTRMANMIICPCKHLSVCRRCDDTITKCPICKAAKISSVEVCLS